MHLIQCFMLYQILQPDIMNISDWLKPCNSIGRSGLNSLQFAIWRPNLSTLCTSSVNIKCLKSQLTLSWKNTPVKSCRKLQKPLFMGCQLLIDITYGEKFDLASNSTVTSVSAPWAKMTMHCQNTHAYCILCLFFGSKLHKVPGHMPILPDNQQ